MAGRLIAGPIGSEIDQMRTDVPRISLKERCFDFDGVRLVAWERSPGWLFIALMVPVVSVALPFAMVIALHDAISLKMADAR